jgi:hypothetical protein
MAPAQNLACSTPHQHSTTVTVRHTASLVVPRLATTTRTLYTLSLRGRALHLSLFLTHLPEEAEESPAAFHAAVQAELLALVRAQAPALLLLCRGSGAAAAGAAPAAAPAPVEALLSAQGLACTGPTLCGALCASPIKTLFATLSFAPGDRLAALPSAGIELTARLATRRSMRAHTLQKLGFAGAGR